MRKSSPLLEPKSGRADMMKKSMCPDVAAMFSMERRQLHHESVDVTDAVRNEPERHSGASSRESRTP